MKAFSDEDNFTVWSSINNCLCKLSILLSHTEYEDLFKAYGRQLMQSVASRLGWDPQANESEYCHNTYKDSQRSLMCESGFWCGHVYLWRKLQNLLTNK
jgi:hypothetical protein